MTAQTCLGGKGAGFPTSAVVVSGAMTAVIQAA